MLYKTISTLSLTERAKYPRSFELASSGKLFSDELRDHHPEFPNEKNQHWLCRAKGSTPEYSYSTSQGDLADVVKVLIIENSLSPLLMLAHHPQIPLRQLHYLSWGHHFGFSRVAEAALRAYLLFNVLAATDTLRGGEYKEMKCYSDILVDLTTTMDYDAQQLPHRAFFHPLLHKDASTFDVHSDYTRLHKYLKYLFNILYQYDVVVRECGLDPKWEEEIVHWINGLSKDRIHGNRGRQFV